MTDYIAVPPRETRPVDRLEWEQILRRARTAGLIASTGKRNARGELTKGGISGVAFMAVAFCVASYGDYDGTRVFPGDAAIAIDCESSLDVVKRVRAKLVELGFLQHVAHPRPGRGEEWRLSVPVDYEQVLEILTPAAHKVLARQLSEKRRGKSRGAQPTPGGPSGSPADDPEATAPGDPVAPPEPPNPEMPGGPTGYAQTASGGPTGGRRGDPVGALTYPLPEPQDDQANFGVFQIRPLTLRAHEAEQRAANIDFPGVSNVDAPRLPLAPAECPEHPGMRGGRRDDGKPNCTFCRRLGLRLVPGGQPPESLDPYARPLLIEETRRP